MIQQGAIEVGNVLAIEQQPDGPALSWLTRNEQGIRTLAWL